MSNKNADGNNSEERFARAEQYLLAAVAFVLSDAMDKSGLSQKALALRLGVSEARISQILNATGNPTVRSLARIADALDCKAQLKLLPRKAEHQGAQVHSRGKIEESPPTRSMDNSQGLHNVISWKNHEATRNAWTPANDEVVSESSEPLYATC